VPTVTAIGARLRACASDRRAADCRLGLRRRALSRDSAWLAPSKQRVREQQVEPRTAGPRPAGPVQGWVLVASAWLAVMANQVIAPVLPTMRQVFGSELRVDFLISLTATLPALFVAALAALFGLLGDRVGHKRVLFGATLLYGVVGTAPTWLATLPGIVVSRALVGVAEAAIMTCSTALIVGHFAGRSRERHLAFQTGTAPIVPWSSPSGAPGESSWRLTVLHHGFASAIPLTGLLIWDVCGASDATATNVVPFRWGTLVGWASILAMSAFVRSRPASCSPSAA
jgi:MFS family permease